MLSHRTFLRIRVPAHREFSTVTTLKYAKPAFQTVQKCPDPTCACAATPPDLDIDRKQNLNGTMAAYRHHAVVRTGVSDWTSRIEDDQRFPIVQTLKKEFGRGGKFHDPFNHTLLSTSSHAARDSSILLFPSFTAISSSKLASAEKSTDNQEFLVEQLDGLIEHYLYPPPSNTGKAKDVSKEESDVVSRPINHLTILICGHGERDSRCGIMGPLLEKEFNSYLQREGWTVDSLGSSESLAADNQSSKTATVELISHVGGHKYAGNVILYFPHVGEWENHVLAGQGIWYGRVEPSHVDGIMKETIAKGVVIEDLFRGGISRNGDIIRL